MLRCTKTPALSTAIAWMSAEPIVEALRAVNAVGVSGSSKLEDRIETSADAVPTTRRWIGSIHAMPSTGPVAMERTIGPLSPSTVGSKL